MNNDELGQNAEEAKAIACISTKVEKLSEIGRKYIESGLEEKGLEILGQAFQLAQSLDDIDERDFALCDVGSAYGKSGKYDIAIEISRLVVGDDFRAWIRILDPLIDDCLRLKLPEPLLKLVKVCQEIGFDGLSAVTKHFVQVRDFEYPDELVNMIESDHKGKILALVDFAKFNFNKGNNLKGLDILHKATALTEKILDDSSRVFLKDIINSVYAKFVS